MTYPTLEEVENADRMQLARWYRFLESPGMSYLKGREHENTNFEEGEKVRVAEAAIQKRILERFQEMGGFTPAISKAIGW